MIQWLTDTLAMTGALMVLVLLVRRPVGRWFGPAAAYALWALPMIRLFLPPLVLPVSLAPAAAVEVQPIAASSPALRHPAAMAQLPVSADFSAFDLVAGLPWTSLLLAIWLGGALMFLAKRTYDYRTMRRELLDGARVLGRSGNIRIVEAPLVEAPVAFGVFDKVVALPSGFLANADSDASDFAIAHELEHHAGHDLIANIAVQPLFALHWFNPLAWMAWRAMRSDQEAACDARVLAGRSRADRERYGRLIASFAAGSKLALAAPMAGPLSGDKPIIHRLKALLRNDVPERHRGLGRSLFAAAVIAVPLTASVTYAAADAPAEPVPAAAPVVVDERTGPDVADVIQPRGDDEARDRADEAGPDKPVSRKHDRIVERQSVHPFEKAEFQRQMADVEAQVEKAGREANTAVEVANRKVRIAMRRMQDTLPAVPAAPTPPAPSAPGIAPAPPLPPQSHFDIELPRMVSVSMACGDRARSIRIPEESAAEVRAAIEQTCDKGRIRAQTLDALREARAEIASETGMSAQQRDYALRAIDAQIAHLGRG